MNYMIVVFRSRSETVSFANILKSYNIEVEIINTPRKANISCGISVKFNEAYLTKAREILSRRYFPSYAGCFRIIINGREINVIPI